MKPQIVEAAPVQEVVHLGNEADAGALPLSRHFEQDAEGAISAPAF